MGSVAEAFVISSSNTVGKCEKEMYETCSRKRALEVDGRVHGAIPPLALGFGGSVSGKGSGGS